MAQDGWSDLGRSPGKRRPWRGPDGLYFGFRHKLMSRIVVVIGGEMSHREIGLLEETARPRPRDHRKTDGQTAWRRLGSNASNPKSH